MTALQVARDGGASYADARLGRYRRQMVGTRERRVETVSDNESYGLGVRVLVGGSWSSVTFQRMPNVSLLPGDQALGLDDLIAATERGIVVKNRGSWSIDQQRYNFQFSGPSTRSAAVRWSAY
jgi:predicted Zn-dependent protease